MALLAPHLGPSNVTVSSAKRFCQCRMNNCRLWRNWKRRSTIRKWTGAVDAILGRSKRGIEGPSFFSKVTLASHSPHYLGRGVTSPRDNA